MELIDSHCHLAGAEFEADLEDVVHRARAAGLVSALVILSSGDEAETVRLVRVRALWPGVRVSVGIHPHQAAQHASDLDASLSALDAELDRHGAVALGEIGLDYHYDFSPRDVQQEVFRRQLRLARERGLPVVIHTREATGDTFAILRTDGAGLRTVFHCFTGSRAMASEALESGAWLSFAGIVTFPKAAELREVARMVPPDRFLVETDAPYLAPVPHRGTRNEPAFVSKVVDGLADIRESTAEVVGRQSVENFDAVFGRGSRYAAAERPT